MAEVKDVPLLIDPSQRSIQELLLKHGIPPKMAKARAQVEFRNFSTEELLACFSRLHQHGPDLKTFDFNSTQSSWATEFASLFKRKTQEVVWLKPRLEFIKESAIKRLALCINAKGEWSLRENGYFALSHVWDEGIQADPQNRGIPLAHVQQIIARIQATGAEWIWLDGLAIPCSSQALTLEEEEIKIAIINNLDGIYRRAESIIIFDALVMQLQSTDFVDVAICLSCGKWMRRLWTFQEIYLSRKAVILTKTGLVDYLTMTARLRSLSGLDDELPEMYASMSPDNLMAIHSVHKDPAKYQELYLQLARVLGTDGKMPSLAQLAMACQDRRTGNDIDYARAFFPILGLRWNSTLSREEGMEMIFNEQRYSAKRLLLMHGVPRSSVRPGWAPSYLTGLVGRPLGPEEPLGDIEWEQRGLKRKWFTYKAGTPIERWLLRMHANITMQINKENPSPRDNIMALEVDCEGTEELCACFIGSNERPETINGFRQAVSNKEAYILTNNELNMVSRHGLAYRAMLVERDTAITSLDEAWVYMAVEVVPIHKSLPGQPKSWLLLHENPTSTYERSGKDFTKMARMLSDEDALHGGKIPLHGAAEVGNEALMTELLSANAALFMAQDERGWTPLHSAAYTGQVNSILFLVQHDAPVDALDSSERSPLMIAADEGHTEAVKQLLNLGADVNLSSEKAQCPLNQALLSNHVETARVLLEAGANPNDQDKFGFAPMTIACRNLETANLLISAGADPSADLVGGATILHFAARAGNVALIKRLLELGMPVDLTEGSVSNGRTALYRAVEVYKLETVEILLHHGASPNHVVQTGWTPTLLAARLGNYEIIKTLVRNGADTQATCQPESWTALHVASQEGHRLVVRLLLDAGWDVNAQDAAGHTPLKLAKTAGHEAVGAVLKQAGGL
ncbi:hypothetical protein TCE0_034r10167 [Talaromyces pinophilus]|uniref:Uncharacterized protein n=1 Tax=Talaromyces pinophilus TaxID=128442 RepID=A0A6V8HC02_TALPI|nr:hypothetical protein TCE0_034r10167 [Talaromyces pinophilus]